MPLPTTEVESVDHSEDTDRAARACPDLPALEALIPTCTACARLRTYGQLVSTEKIKRYAADTYWNRPASGFGDPRARILLVGLAPAAHGANRTGRVFTGDPSGDFLYAALHRVGLASQPHSVRPGDGMQLTGVYIGIAARCAPPDNRPTPVELRNCRPYLARELELLTDLRVAVPLGAIAHEALLRTLVVRDASLGSPARFKFAHGARHQAGALTVLDSYHVSARNTYTGLLTPQMLDELLFQARQLAGL